MDPEDTRILKLAGRNLANYASTMQPSSVIDGSLASTLSFTWNLLNALLKKLNVTASKPVDQHSHAAKAHNDAFDKGQVVSLLAEAGSASHPFFGRLRRDNYDNVVKKLLGDPRPDPILIPVVLTDDSMPAIANDYQSAASSLQRICNACSLLLQQRQMIKNAPAFAASASQYALTTTLPAPHLDPKYCFWRKSPMRRETQVYLLFLIRRLCRIYAASTACVQQSRGLIAIRSITFATATCIADAICRVEATDDPSPFCLHYSGNNEGPTQPFGLKAGSFESLASNLPIYDPRYCSLRSQSLDYLRGISLKQDGSKRPTIFNFDQSLTPRKGDITLIEQLSIQLALPRPYPPSNEKSLKRTARLMAGTNGSIIEVLPEVEYFRDIVFYFKHSVSGKAPTPESTSDEHTWHPSDATLKWKVQPVSAEDPTPQYAVTAFQGHPQEFVQEISDKEATQSAFSSFLAFFKQSSGERTKLSSADPTNIVNSCSEKYANSKSKPIPVRNEDDILHLTSQELPTFGNMLTASDAERFLQFLTVPYIRIPLVLDFFANGDPSRLSGLKSKSLQLIVDSVLFEPGTWKPSDYCETVKEIPVLDKEKLQALLATPHGCLFNELAKSPDVVTTSVIRILERCLEMDVGKYDKTTASGPMILYAVRLAVRMEGFLKMAIKHCSGAFAARPRGLETLDVNKIQAAKVKIRSLLDKEAFRILEYWIDPSRVKDVDSSCIVHAHLLYLFRNHTYEDLNFHAISVILSSQVYLMINHRFSSSVYDDLQDTADPTHPPPSIQIAQSEIFDIIQSQRYHVLQYMRHHPDDADDAMEAVVRIATGTGKRELADDDKKKIKAIALAEYITPNMLRSFCPRYRR
jgi:hypothetical protein